MELKKEKISSFIEYCNILIDNNLKFCIEIESMGLSSYISIPFEQLYISNNCLLIETLNGEIKLNIIEYDVDFVNDENLSYLQLKNDFNKFVIKF